jgi:hypothetical protein
MLLACVEGVCLQVDALLLSQQARAQKLMVEHIAEIVAVTEVLSRDKVGVCCFCV